MQPQLKIASEGRGNLVNPNPKGGPHVKKLAASGVSRWLTTVAWVWGRYCRIPSSPTPQQRPMRHAEEPSLRPMRLQVCEAYAYGALASSWPPPLGVAFHGLRRLSCSSSYAGASQAVHVVEH